MKKTVWKPTKEDLDEIGFTGEYDDYHDEYQFWFTGTTDIKCIFCCFSVTWNDNPEFSQNDSTPIYPRSKEELQAFISMFEEDE